MLLAEEEAFHPYTVLEASVTGAPGGVQGVQQLGLTSHFVVLGVLKIVWRFGGIICLGRADVRVIANCTEDVQTMELDSVVVCFCVVRHICTCHVSGSFCQAALGQTRPGLEQSAAWLTHGALAQPVSTGGKSALHMESIAQS